MVTREKSKQIIKKPGNQASSEMEATLALELENGQSSGRGGVDNKIRTSRYLREYMT